MKLCKCPCRRCAQKDMAEYDWKNLPAGIPEYRKKLGRIDVYKRQKLSVTIQPLTQFWICKINITYPKTTYSLLSSGEKRCV